MSNGYDMTCQPGALGMQDCFINVHTPAGCITGAPGCVITQQKVVKWTDAGPITQAPSTSSWMAWVPQLWSLNIQGDQYSPFGPSGIPYTMDGMVGWAGKGSDFDIMGWTDPQSKAYLDSAPGAQAREMYQERTCNPLWSNVFGCKLGDIIWVSHDAVAQHEPSFFAKLKSLFSAEDNGETTDVDCELSDWVNADVGNDGWSLYDDVVGGVGCGTRTRTRTVITAASGNGAVCEHLEEIETKDCVTGETVITTQGGQKIGRNPWASLMFAGIGVAGLGLILKDVEKRSSK